MKRGTQVAYVPLHTGGDLSHPDVEFGFVTRMNTEDQTHMCRFWRKGEPGQLRTVANSELCYDYSLVEYKSVDQALVSACLVELGYEG